MQAHVTSVLGTSVCVLVWQGKIYIWFICLPVMAMTLYQCMFVWDSIIIIWIYDAGMPITMTITVAMCVYFCVFLADVLTTIVGTTRRLLKCFSASRRKGRFHLKPSPSESTFCLHDIRETCILVAPRQDGMSWQAGPVTKLLIMSPDGWEDSTWSLRQVNLPFASMTSERLVSWWPWDSMTWAGPVTKLLIMC